MTHQKPHAFNPALTVIFVLGLVLTACSTKMDLPIQDITVYKTPTCGCCGIYSQYLQKEGLNVNVKEVTDLSAIKSELNIPTDLQSCHTSKIGDYFVEGHVPLEAVKKLLSEQPNIAGIALPGMPAGSPGMPGKKDGPWTIYAINHDGSYDVFTVM